MEFLYGKGNQKVKISSTAPKWVMVGFALWLYTDTFGVKCIS